MSKQYQQDLMAALKLYELCRLPKAMEEFKGYVYNMSKRHHKDKMEIMNDIYKKIKED